MMNLDGAEMAGAATGFEDALAKAVISAAAVEVACVGCGETEMVLPLDRIDEPLGEAFLANYVCSVCDEPEPTGVRGSIIRCRE